MDIKDVKVGMLVQMNDNSSKQGCVGKVESIDYWAELVLLRLEGVTTDSAHNTNTCHLLCIEGPSRFEPYQDPEADMVVWDALEVGEHFYAPSGFEAVKVNFIQYAILKGSVLHTIDKGPLYKYKLA